MNEQNCMNEQNTNFFMNGEIRDFFTCVAFAKREPKGQRWQFRSGHTGAYPRPANPYGSGADTPERTYARRIQMAPNMCRYFIIFRIFFGGATGEKHLCGLTETVVRLAATETDCPMPRFRATRYPCKTINRSKGGLARSCQKPPCRRESRAHVYRVVIRQDRLVVS
jgi:hypothetical protein